MIDNQRKKRALITLFTGIVVALAAAPALVAGGVDERYVVADVLGVVALIITFAIVGVS